MGSNMEMYIFDDEELYTLSEISPAPEGSPLSEFLDEVQVVARAIKAVSGELDRPPSGSQRQILLLMRAFYLLGVLRGGEAYRNSILALKESGTLETLSFSLDAVNTDDTIWELEHMEPGELDAVLASLGLRMQTLTRP